MQLADALSNNTTVEQIQYVWTSIYNEYIHLLDCVYAYICAHVVLPTAISQVSQEGFVPKC